jgi:predicted esterase
MRFSKDSISILFLFIIFIFCTKGNAESRLSQVKNLKISYSVENDKLTASWDKVGNAGKYLLNIYDIQINQIVSIKTIKTSVSISAEHFAENNPYSAEITALKTGNFLPSETKKKDFTFSSRVPTAEITQDFAISNSGERSGRYFLPKNYRLKTLPLMVIFHGSNTAGSNVLKLFKDLAKEKNFIIAAPDSSNPAGWDVPSDFSQPSEDQIHTYDVLDELYSLPDISIDHDRILIIGISAGGAMAAFLGTNDIQFKKIADLHGGVILNELGSNKVPFWLSTGTIDTLRPPAELIEYKSGLENLNFPTVEYHEYQEAHQVLQSEEEELINWWLAPEVAIKELDNNDVFRRVN